MRKFPVAIYLALLASTLSAPAQGPLTPPGPPAPMMKTLDQAEPRKPISSLPFVIDQPGSYYVTANLTGVSGQHGIRVTVNDVTIDLMGHTLTGVPDSLAGIAYVGGDIEYTTVRNGLIVKWGSSGLSLGAHSRAEGVTVRDNGFNGIVLGGASIAVDCIAINNVFTGIRMMSDGIIHRCEARQNTGVGLAAGAAGVISQSVARANSGAGIDVGDAATVQGCTTLSNTGHNIRTGSGALIARCTAQLAAGSSDGIQVISDCQVLENDVRENGGSGIRATGVRNRIENNHSSRNNIGFNMPLTNGNNLIIKNSAVANIFANFNVASGNRLGLLVTPAVNGSTVTGNTGGTSIPDPWANFALPPLP